MIHAGTWKIEDIKDFCQKVGIANNRQGFHKHLARTAYSSAGLKAARYKGFIALAKKESFYKAFYYVSRPNQPETYIAIFPTTNL